MIFTLVSYSYFLGINNLQKRSLAAASTVLSALLLLIFLCHFFFPAESQILAEVDRMHPFCCDKVKIKILNIFKGSHCEIACLVFLI